ncbi:MAG TPA: hypothetical protein VIG30_08290 [Ktedonobacterales bacterium]|jgi:hypothetical protein
MYTQPATALSPALVIYLIDASDTMNEVCGTATKIALVNLALRVSVRDMVRRSMRDGVPQPRYKVAIYAYSTTVVDILGGVRDLPDLLKMGLPELVGGGVTDTAAGFEAVYALLIQYLRYLAPQCPAPLVCHLTDGVFTQADPTPAVRRIQALQVADGPVLVENVYVADGMLRRPVADWHQWGGITKPADLADEYARFLLRISSPLPETYRQNINDYGYQLQPGSAFFFPGFHSDLVRLAFTIASSTMLK